jgi:hypothetical protein
MEGIFLAANMLGRCRPICRVNLNLSQSGQNYHIYCSSYWIRTRYSSQKKLSVVWAVLLANVGDGRASQRDVASSSA